MGSGRLPGGFDGYLGPMRPPGSVDAAQQGVLMPGSFGGWWGPILLPGGGGPGPTPPPPTDGDASVSISEYGNFNTPQTFSGASAATFILGQWWYDFSRLTTVQVIPFLGVEAMTNGGGTGRFGVFILADGDPVIGNLFTSITPDVELTVSNLTAFHGYNNATLITRPAGKMQVLLAAQPENAGTIVSWRSALIKVAETP